MPCGRTRAVLLSAAGALGVLLAASALPGCGRAHVPGSVPGAPARAPEPTRPAEYAALAAQPIPRTLGDALEALERSLPRETIQALYASETDVTLELQDTLGRFLREHWGLWTGGPLADHLRGLGLDHPDDMSGVILTSFWRRLHFQPLRVEAQVRWYQAFRSAGASPDPRSNPACAGRVDITAWWTPPVDARGSQPSSPSVNLRIVHLGTCTADARLWAWEAGRGWFEPDEALRAFWARPR
jgi:hypothetical protein